MIVVSDTTILSNLIQADLLFILHQLYEEVVIPEAVAAELSRLDTSLPGRIYWLRIYAIDHPERADALQMLLDRGESEAIILAQDLGADWLRIDEQRGRRYARQLNLRITGTLGVLLVAKQAGLIDSVGNAVELIRQRAGAWYQDALVKEVLRQANETND